MYLTARKLKLGGGGGLWLPIKQETGRLTQVLESLCFMYPHQDTQRQDRSLASLVWVQEQGLPGPCRKEAAGRQGARGCAQERTRPARG